MLPQNFQVGRQILNNVAKNSVSAFHFSKKISKDDKFINWSKSKINLTPVQYQEKFKQCPKPSFAQLCCKKLFSKPQLKKYDATTASDDYLKARQSLKSRIENLVKFVEDESRSIASNMESSLKNSKVAREIQIEKLFRTTLGKLDELIKLDVSYGSWMRKETLLLNDEIRRSFDALERAIAPNAKRIMHMLKDLQSNVSICVERAQKNLVTCRKHNVPSNLTECVKKQSDEATKRLDQMNEEVRHKLKEITNFRETVMKAHEMTAQEVTEVNRKKAVELVKYLERCIGQLKRSNK
ncbi:uncharacterized protein [Anoplolepis gracilipes]|uniref:uncharacterized protein n=1 Tax=Anoplolepis gracilipes TaxID=354296 RepID=UPI003BA03D2E